MNTVVLEKDPVSLLSFSSRNSGLFLPSCKSNCVCITFLEFLSSWMHLVVENESSLEANLSIYAGPGALKLAVVHLRDGEDLYILYFIFCLESLHLYFEKLILCIELF
ncbi:uncharacterized protein DS421_11g338420 [Arachis hypogaea]|nr:uncharacterized protein DS421_11g338420 [Arachis hypogaea]